MSNNDELTKEQREEEFQVLESIYPEYIVQHAEDLIRLEIPVELGERRTITLQSEAQLSDLTLELSYLPSILLEIVLPTSYPSRTAPAIRSIHATHFWLTQTAELARELHGLWTKGDGVLCEFVEFLRSGEFLRQLGMEDSCGNIRFVLVANVLFFEID